ncbi:MAG: preprotein translocase subunit SecE [Deferribacteraceae bacterium]|jgi:preprotein translocase subunit SecE|nr:preprotein translocase subunit SecE [Deferribacteraceae bacterium]
MPFEPKVFYKEVREELQKVTWPTKENTVATSFVVVVVVILITLYLGAADLFFSQIFTAILG